MRFFILTTLVCMAPLSNAIERVAATPYTGDGASFKSTSSLSLPTCASDEALTSLGGNTFSCISVKDTLPGCSGPNQALAVSGNTFVCTTVVQNAPKCDEGYGLVGDGNQTLSCVKNQTPPACDAGQVLTSDQGQFKCVTVGRDIPVCDASQVLTTQGGAFVCKQISQTNCDGRVVQNWGGVNYCSNMTCGDDQVLSMVGGYMQCVTKYDGSTVNMDRLLACQKEDMFYNPSSPYATSAGCVRSCGDGMNFETGLYCNGGTVVASDNNTLPGQCLDFCRKQAGVTCCQWSGSTRACVARGNGAHIGASGQVTSAVINAINCKSGGN